MRIRLQAILSGHAHDVLSVVITKVHNILATLSPYSSIC
jgi:hypothetical protein